MLFGIFDSFTGEDRKVLLLITAQLTALSAQVEAMSEALTTLTDRVSEIETVADSAIALLGGIKAALDEAIAANDPAALSALSERLAAQTDELALAVAANTLADPENPPDE